MMRFAFLAFVLFALCLQVNGHVSVHVDVDVDSTSYAAVHPPVGPPPGPPAPFDNFPAAPSGYGRSRVIRGVFYSDMSAVPDHFQRGAMLQDSCMNYGLFDGFTLAPLNCSQFVSALKALSGSGTLTVDNSVYNVVSTSGLIRGMDSTGTHCISSKIVAHTVYVGVGPTINGSCDTFFADCDRANIEAGTPKWM